ncbi:MAG TPA: polymer-forming cytoskeletal protein [Dissulfurispiraceae bacterium]
MSNKVLAAKNPGDSSQETVTLVKLPEYPVNEPEAIPDDRELREREQATPVKSTIAGAGKAAVRGVNAINKGSKLTGNLIITQDIEITGDVEGDISSEEDSNIFIKGSCKGNIRTKGGSVEIEGDMSGGDIVAGGYVKIEGKFHGGKIQARERIHINGEFSGTLESNEIEVGSGAQGRGEIFYKEHLSIQKGAKVEGRITRIGSERKTEPERKEDTPQKKGFFAKK